MKGMYKASSLMLAGLFVSLVIVIMMSVLSSGSQKYGVEFDNQSYEAFNKFEEISATTKQIQEQTEKAGADAGVLDILGVFFSDAYKALKLTKESYQATDAMIQAGSENLPIGNNAKIFRQVASAALLVIVFVGIILAAIIKRDL